MYACRIWYHVRDGIASTYTQLLLKLYNTSIPLLPKVEVCGNRPVQSVKILLVAEKNSATNALMRLPLGSEVGGNMVSESLVGLGVGGGLRVC